MTEKPVTPSVWGEGAWRFMHVVALGYDPSRKDEYKRFYEALPNVLPCRICGEDLKRVMKEKPIDLEGSKELFRWTVRIHNDVNRKLGKPPMDASYVRNQYIYEGSGLGKSDKKPETRVRHEDPREKSSDFLYSRLGAVAIVGTGIWFAWRTWRKRS